MRVTDVLDHRLYFPPNGLLPPEGRLAAVPGLRAHLVNQLLVFDHVLIPTIDFGIAADLVDWLGLDVAQDVLCSGVVRLVRRPHALVYVGAGLGVSTVAIGPGPDRPLSAAQVAMWSAVPDAVQARLDIAGLPSGYGDVVLGTTVEYESPSNEAFIERVEEQTYRDILSSPLLSSLVRALEGGEAPLDLKRLPSIGANQTQALVYGPPRTAPQAVLQIAEANQQLVMAGDLGLRDVYTHQGVETLLGEKLRAATGSASAEGFIRVLDLAELPDVGGAVEDGRVDFSDVWTLRETPDARKFRDWLAAVDPEDPRQVERALVAALMARAPASGLGARALRLAATVGIGLLNPVAGVGASLADSVVDRLAMGWRPRIFLDRIAAMLQREPPRAV